MIPHPLILPYKGVLPSIGADVFLTPGITLIGDVELGPQVSIWFGSIVRGDVNRIRIGGRTNVQDGCILHVTRTTPLVIGESATIAHGVILHGCTIGTGALVGIGARVLDGAVVGEGSLIGAGSLVVPNCEIPPGVLALGAPARVVRPLREEEKRGLLDTADRYVAYATAYRTEIARSGP
jgi:gamma-carbonic anhydrase